MPNTPSFLARTGPAAIAITSLLIAWQLYSDLSGISPTTLPSPARVANQAWLNRDALVENALPTVRATLLGFSCSLAAAFLLSAMMDFFERFDERKYGTDGGPLHDPNVIAWLLSPEIYAGRAVNVEVETGSELTMGQTVIDWWGTTDRPKNATVIREVDDNAFFALLLERIGRL